MTSNRLGKLLTLEFPDLKQLRNDKGWSAAELGRKVGLTAQTIYNLEQGKAGKKTNVLKILKALDYQGPPMSWMEGWKGEKTDEQVAVSLVEQIEAAPVPSLEPSDEVVEPETGDEVVLAFQSFLDKFQAKVAEQVRTAIIENLKDMALPRVKAEFPLTPILPPAYVPTPDQSVFVSDNAALSVGLPTKMSKMEGWAVHYTRRFLKELDGSGGIKGIAINQIKRFSEGGEVFSNIGFKKLFELHKSHPNWLGADYEFRINRRWRILLKKSREEKTYTLLRVAHHDETE